MNSITDVYQRLLASQQQTTDLVINCNERIILIKHQDHLIYADENIVKVTYKKQFLFWTYTQKITDQYVETYEEIYQQIETIMSKLQQTTNATVLV